MSAVAKGGIITFNCGPDPVTIAVTSTAKVYNDKGIMHNLGDTLDDLQRMLRRQFKNVEVQRYNKVALFVVRD